MPNRGPRGSARFAETVCALRIDQRDTLRPQSGQCDNGTFERTVDIVATLTIDSSGTVRTSTGVAVVSGTAACSQTTPLTIEVTGIQMRHDGRVNATVQATTRVQSTCNGARAWSAALTPVTGAFDTSPMVVTVRTVPDGSVLPAAASRSNIRFA